MQYRPPSALVVTTVFVAIVTAYTGGYFASSRVRPQVITFVFSGICVDTPSGRLERVFENRTLARMYVPAVWLESRYRGTEEPK